MDLLKAKLGIVICSEDLEKVNNAHNSQPQVIPSTLCSVKGQRSHYYFLMLIKDFVQIVGHSVNIDKWSPMCSQQGDMLWGV